MTKDTLNEAITINTEIEFWKTQLLKFPEIIYLEGLSTTGVFKDGGYGYDLSKYFIEDLLENLTEAKPRNPDLYKILFEEANRANHFIRLRINAKIAKLELQLEKL